MEQSGSIPEFRRLVRLWLLMRAVFDFLLAFSLLRLPLALARRIASTFQYDLQVTFPATLVAQ